MSYVSGDRDIYRTSLKYKERIKKIIQKCLNVWALLLYIQYRCKLVKYNQERNEITHVGEHYFYGGTWIIFNLEDCDEAYDETRESISEKNV